MADGSVSSFLQTVEAAGDASSPAENRPYMRVTLDQDLNRPNLAVTYGDTRIAGIPIWAVVLVVLLVVVIYAWKR